MEEMAPNMLTNDDDDNGNGKKSAADDDGPAILIYEDSPSGSDDDLRTRETWSGKLDFLMSSIGLAVGLGNIWRFPYLCYKNGGGAFLIPYVISLVTAGIPMFFLEVALGQFMQEGGLTVWRICPLLKGIGFGTTIVCFLANVYYIIILAWSLYYIFMSFAPVVPWASCGNEWNTPRCFDHFDDSVRNISSDGLNSSLPPGMVMINGTLMKVIDPVEEFWYNKVLQISSGVDDLGSLRWELVLCLILAWVICYFCIWKGVKSSGKAVYFTATFPYVILFILFIRGITLTGATKGIKYYLMPDFERLKEPDVWIEAGTQVFYSYTIALGALTALGSYNKFNNNCYKDCIIVALINSGTSFVSGFVVFSVLGFMAHEQDVDVGAVAESGPGLAFLAYPKAITQMPIAPLWAILFFFMLLLLGLGSEFVAVEGFVTAVVDSFPQTLRRGHRREALVACVVFVSFCIGLTMVTNGGLYVFYVWDYYASSGMTLLWFCFFECIAIGWLYGANKFYDDIELMVGFRINPWLRICWTYVTPVVTCAIFVFELVRYVPLKIEGSFFSYEYPMWAQSCGWCLALTSMSMVPIYAIYKLLSTPGTFRERWILTTTAKLKPHQMKENVTSAPCSQAELRDLLSAPEKPGEVSRISSLLPITNDKEDQ